ncbi:lmo1851 family serine protease [Sporosarcina aquimarina]|uniref:S41 family peptidase n=1 Tax=Sporosarcina aquimarina TaxID=114975 RepID=A0ABU4FXZ7_9BACL|nr:S41 family peptidase [Sporosarcina aquimarina]MDW0109575.1 S41 family peptidase [Sporosarcina aquimarina]
MDENEQNGQNRSPEPERQPSHNRYFRIKPFSFVMLIFTLVILTAGITFFALTFGDDKVVEVVSPQKTERQEFQKLYDAYDEIKKNYFEDIDDKAVLDGAINGMVDSLDDPYSDYLNTEETENLMENISSSFQGIGAEIQEADGYIKVVSPIKNSPAEKEGLLPNDLIQEVDGKSIQGMSSSEAVMLIRGEKGTTVTLTIKRGEKAEPFQVKIKRDDIPIETVYAEMLDGGIAHIRMTTFSEHTYDELLTALDDMEAKGMKGLVLDVRQNPGGVLDGAMKISDLFVEKGKTVLQTEEKGKKAILYPASGGRKVEVPVALVVDDGSASASEILAGALKESSDIPIVGIKTFGKGTVQSPKDLKDGSNLKITTAKWLTPDGNWIHKKGIEPDVKVDYPSYAMLPFLDPSEELKDGNVSSNTQPAKEMLKAVGYDPGKIDGLYDEKTIEAVKKLQKDLKLEETGVLTGDTTIGLMNKLREKIEKDDPQLLKAKEVVLEKIGK